jgi:hypothetical protein
MRGWPEDFHASLVIRRSSLGKTKTDHDSQD